MDLAALFNLIEILNVLAFPGGHVVPGGFDDSTAVLVSICKIGGYCEVCNVSTSDVLNPNVSDAAAEPECN